MVQKSDCHRLALTSTSAAMACLSAAEEVAAGAIGHCRRSDLLCHFSSKVRRAVTNLLNPIPLAPKFMLKDLLISRRERPPHYPLWEDRPRAFQ